MNEDVWFTLDDIKASDSEDRLYCISVDSPEKQFLAGKIGVTTHNSEQGKAEDELNGEASMIISSIARLGRAAGVHLVIATQRPDATLIPGETKANLGVRVNCGRTDSNASSMILGSGEGTRVRANPKGRLYLRIYGDGDHGQGFFAEADWIDKYLANKGLNPDGSPITKPRSRLANITDMSEFEGSDLDSREGIDNAAEIERIRQEEAEGNFGEPFAGGDEWAFDDGEGDSPESSGGSTAVTFDDDELEDKEADGGEDEHPGGMKPLNLTAKKDDENKWHRPEDDWDIELDDLIKENNS